MSNIASQRVRFGAPPMHWLGSGCLAYASGRPTYVSCPPMRAIALREAVERALALDPNLAVAHAQLSRIQRQVDFDWAGGDASIQRAIALEPGNPEGIRLAASSAAGTFGRFDEALQLNRRAVDLDPLNADSWESLGEIEFWMGQLDKAARDSGKGLELSPDAWPGHSC